MFAAIPIATENDSSFGKKQTESLLSFHKIIQNFTEELYNLDLVTHIDRVLEETCYDHYFQQDQLY